MQTLFLLDTEERRNTHTHTQGRKMKVKKLIEEENGFNWLSLKKKDSIKN